MPRPDEIIANLKHHGRLTTEPVEALEKCCRHLLEAWRFDAVFLAFASTVQAALETVACAGETVLMEKAVYRVGIEDRLALLKVPFRTLLDITGKPTFTASGTLRIQKPSSGVITAAEAGDRNYVLLGLVHREARKYEDRVPEEVSTVWRDVRDVLIPLVLKAAERKAEAPPPPRTDRPVEDSVRLDALQIPVQAPPAAGDGAGKAPPEGPRSIQRPVELVDAGTRLFNRHYFVESLSIEVERARRYQRTVSLLLIQVTALKPVHGEEDWNRLAVLVAEILVKALRRVDIVCRFDRNKFAVILPDTAHLTLGIVVKRIFKLFRQSVGEDPVACLNLCTLAYPDHAENDSALLLKGEEMLAQAVAAGPNKAVLSD
jgi:diguanylate cyclase (GGDEF)-like protein